MDGVGGGWPAGGYLNVSTTPTLPEPLCVAAQRNPGLPGGSNGPGLILWS